MSKSTGNPLGRPKKPKGKNPVGRPKGEAAVMRDFRQRMLASPKSRKVLQSLFDVALDPDHKHWPAATKMVMDRIAPTSGFDKEAGGTGRSSITVHIEQVGQVDINTEDSEVVPEEVAAEAEYTVVESSE